MQVASGEKLPLSQEDICLRGHAFEARICAESPDNNFMPCTGLLQYLTTPVQSTDIRVETGITVTLKAFVLLSGKRFCFS